jgi:hypothetical protein
VKDNGVNLRLLSTTVEEPLGVAAETAPLLPLSQANAVCLSVTSVDYRPYQRTKLLFKFSIVEPESYAGTILEMFVRTDAKWKTLPPASKLLKIACVANGTRLRRGQTVVPSMFVHRVFKCRLRKVGEGAAAYTIVDTLLEKLTG